MAFLSHQRFVHEASGTYMEELSFFGSTLEETDAEMRQWIMRTMPLGACTIFLQTTYATDGAQHHITLSWLCTEKIEDRVEPKGFLSSTELA